VTTPTATEFDRSGTIDLGSFTFDCGESIPRLEVAYETYGEYNGDNAVLVCHALTGGPRVASRTDDPDDGPDDAHAWWDDVVGPGGYVDTDRYFVVCANVPGSCYGTTGPASVNPETGDPYGPDFPPVSVGDWVEAQRRLLDSLGVGDLHAVLGGSVGGMNAVEWAKRYPDRADRVVAVATAARVDAQILGLNATARRAITTDPAWNDGRYYGDGPDPNAGLAQARRIAHVTYRSKASMDDRFGRTVADRPDPRKAKNGRETDRNHPASTPTDPTARASPYRDVASYLDYNARTFVDRFDANAYLYCSRAMDDYDLAEGHESDAAALAGFDGEATVVSFTGDWHFTVDAARELADALQAAGAEVTHRVVDSTYGHDAFLAEPDRVGPAVARGLREAETEAAGRAPVHASLFD
jgi:homoserine O-acetyltransferase